MKNESQKINDGVFISVIIPCYNSRKFIAGCLGGIMDQNSHSYEIIVVDDRSDDGTYELLRDICDSKAGMRLIRNEANYGPAYSRNAGVKESSGKILFFIDSDCAVEDKDLLLKHVLAHQDYSAHIIGGGVQGIGVGLVAKADNYSHWFLNIPYSANRVKTHLVTNNMSVKRDVFEKLGGFTTALRTGEDTDFCERARETGYKLALRTDAVVKHFDRERLRDFLRNFYLAGLDRIPARKNNKHRYGFLLPSGFFLSLIYFIPLALLLSLQVLAAWFRYDKKVILYFPLIFLGRLAMAWGIVCYCFKENHFFKKCRT